jgi:RND family efflux transporter MFP subunit
VDTFEIRQADGREPRSAPREGSVAIDGGPRGGLVRALRAIVRFVFGVALAAGLIAAGLAANRYMVATKPAPPVRPTLEVARPVEQTIARIVTAEPTLLLYGQVTAGRTVDLRMLVGGEVREVSPRLLDGGRVEAGEVLVAVDAFDWEGALVRARTELAEAEARIAETNARITLERDAAKRAVEQRQMAERETERLTTLQARGVTSNAALDASASRLAAALSAVEGRDNMVRVLEAQRARETASLDRLRWNVEKAARDVRNTRLTAPFAGVVSNVAAELGRLLNVNDRVATLVDLDRLEVRFTLTDGQYARLVAARAPSPTGASAGATGKAAPLTGLAVVIVWQGGGRELRIPGRIDRVSPVIAAASGGIDIFAVVERHAESAVLRPGAFVSVEAPDVAYRGVVRLAQSALHPGSQVFVIGADNRLTAVAVEVAGYDGEHVLVRGSIRDGQRILTTRLPDAGPGLLVRAR